MSKAGPVGAKRYWAPHLVPSNRAEPGPWTVALVEPGESKVHAASRQAFMPLPATRQDLMIARHELGHVQTGFTQVDENGAEIDPSGPVAAFSRMLQEPMVEVIAGVQGFDIRQARDGLDFENMTAIEPQDWYTLARMTLQYAYSVGASKNHKLKAHAAGVMQMMRQHPSVRVLDAAYAEVVRAAEHYGHQPKNLVLRDKLGEVIARQARILAETFGPEEKATTPERATKEQQQAEIDVVRQLAQARLEQAAADAKEQAERQEDGKEEASPAIKASGLTDTVITIHRHVTAKRAGKRAPALWRSSPDSGPMRFPQRFLDGEPFARRSKGGGILVDCSSSNSAAIAGLADTIKKLPNLWVGTHVGTRSLPSEGRICVIAEKGRFGWVEREPDSGGNEGTDLPALKLMVREASAPYIWVSDGEAWSRTAMQNGNADAYTTAVTDFCRKHKIVRVEKIEQARDYALGGQVDVFEWPHTVWVRGQHSAANRPQSTRKRR